MIADVSKHQDDIDWGQLFGSLDFAVVKASGKTKDPFFEQNASGCKRYNVPMHVFHFLYCTTIAKAKAEAKLFSDSVGSYEPLFWVLDCEKASGIAAKNARSIVEAFEAELRRLRGDGIRVAVYIAHELYKSWALDYGRYAYVWIPRYGDNDGTIEGSKRPSHPCDLWQYTSRGKLPGIKGNVDLNTLNGDKPLSFFTNPTDEKRGDDMGTKVTPIDRLIAVAEAEIGYLEKKSNKDLDDKTANAGSANYTKYNRDMKAWAGSAGLHDQWCQNFVDWCFVTAFGLEQAKKLIYVFTNYTPTGSSAFKKRDRYIKRGKGTPKRGDVIYFYSSAKGRIGHVGIVYRVSGSKVYTIEGNTSGASSLVTNGGGVRKKSYSMSSSYIDGYGSVDYSAVDGKTDDELRRGDTGDAVTALQKALLIWDANCLPDYGADGDFGEETEKAVKAFQKSAGLTATGVYDAATKKALTSYGKPKYVEVTGGSVNIRSAPGYGSKVLGTAHKGDRLLYQGETKQAEDKDWYLVVFNDQNAWISSKYAVFAED